MSLCAYRLFRWPMCCRVSLGLAVWLRCLLRRPIAERQTEAYRDRQNSDCYVQRQTRRWRQRQRDTGTQRQRQKRGVFTPADTDIDTDRQTQRQRRNEAEVCERQEPQWQRQRRGRTWDLMRGTGRQRVLDGVYRQWERPIAEAPRERQRQAKGLAGTSPPRTSSER